MAGSAVVYLGLLLALAGLVMVFRPVRRIGVNTRPQAALVLVAGASLALLGLWLPARESRVAERRSRLDDFLPSWQFREFHSLAVDAPPELVFEAIRQVRADEVPFLHLLVWIRRGGRDTPESILNPGNEKPLLDVALRSGFTLLADDAPREIVIGTDPIPGTRAVMNFAVQPLEGGRSLVSTETRVYAGQPGAKRVFGAYWRVIYPGSALIRRMWLRAIRKRAEGS